MTRTVSFGIGSLVVLASTGAAQLLASGNGQLPTCGSNCAQLIEAAGVCGGTTSADQAVWTCFCSSASLTTLYNSPTGICDASCTTASDNRQVMAWFVSNCGTDFGSSEHAPNGGTTTVVITSTRAPSSAGSTASVSKASGASLPSTTAQAGVVASEDAPNEDDNWWNTHYVRRSLPSPMRPATPH
nr:hypothetical protein CFP56_04196 [Quercus suber]